MNDRKGPSIGHVIRSMLAAFIGVQSNENHDQDDSYIDDVGFLPYIIAGIVLTVAFVVIIWLVVTLILR